MQYRTFINKGIIVVAMVTNRFHRYDMGCYCCEICCYGRCCRFVAAHSVRHSKAVQCDEDAEDEAEV